MYADISRYIKIYAEKKTIDNSIKKNIKDDYNDKEEEYG